MKRLINKVAARMLSTTPVGDVGPFRGYFYPEELRFAVPRRVLLRRRAITECIIKTKLQLAWRFICRSTSLELTKDKNAHQRDLDFPLDAQVPALTVRATLPINDHRFRDSHHDTTLIDHAM